MDIYKEVGIRVGLERRVVKHLCFHLFYSNTDLPENPKELVEWLVKYIEV